MKIPTSPLLFTLALSSSTLAYPTPRQAESSPNPEASPLLPCAHGTPDARAVLEDDGWGTMGREKIPGRFARRFGIKRQIGNINGLLGGPAVADSAGSAIQKVSAGLGGLGLGAVGTSGSGVAQTLLGPNGQNSGIGGLGAGLLDGSGGRNELGGLSGVVDGLPIVGGLAGSARTGNGIAGLVNDLPVAGGVIGGLVNGNGIGGLANGLPIVGGAASGLGNVLKGLPIVGGVPGNLLGQMPQQVASSAPMPVGQPYQLAQKANLNLGQSAAASANSVPSLVANLGEGHYLLSSGQILNLGNLGPAVTGLPAVDGLASQVSGGLSGVVGGSKPTQGALEQIQGGYGNAQTTLGGLAGVGNIGDTGRYVNLGGQLVPLEQAREILANAGVLALDTTGSYASDPTFDDGNPTTNSAGPSGENDQNHETPAEAFQAADPANALFSPDGLAAETQSLLAAESSRDDGSASEPVAKAESSARGIDSPWYMGSQLRNAASSVDNGYQNPFPGYRSAGDDGALDLIMGAMRGAKPSLTISSEVPSSTTVVPSNSPSDATTRGPPVQDGYRAVAQDRKGWSAPSHARKPSGYSRPAQASSTMSVVADPTRVSSTMYTAPTPTTDPDDGFREDGSWDEEDTWGDWVSAQPSATGA